MTWGPYWMFYACPECGAKFKHTLDRVDDDKFGVCPVCHAKADLKGESKAEPSTPSDYEIAWWA